MTEHDEIQRLLASYCGDDLTPADRARIEAHLSLCPSCRSELADLETTLRLVRSQPEVEPPPWMTTRIMARVREQSQRQKQGWLQRLFLPLHVKLPLEALALVLICFTGYYVARDVGRQMNPSQISPPSASVPTVKEETAAPQQRQERQPAAAPPHQPASRPAASAPAAIPAPSPAPVQPPIPSPALPLAEPAAPAAPSKEEAISPSADSKETIRGEYAPVLESAPRLHKAAPAARNARSIGSGTAGSEADSMGFAAPAATPRQLRVRLSVADPGRADPMIRRAVSSTGGNISGQPAAQQLTVRIPAHRLSALLEQLGAIGRFTERPAVDGLSGTIELTIRW
jgi:predicted integral membrane protein DUF2275/putative zinc finger protein